MTGVQTCALPIYHFILGRYNADGSLNWEDYGGGIPIGGNYSGFREHLDFNGDNIPDVLTQNSSGQWYASENYGNSYVTTLSNFSFPVSEQRQVLIGDFTGDGKDDMISQKVISGYGMMGPTVTAEWYLHASNGNGTFTTSLFHTRPLYTNATTSDPHVWVIGGMVGDFDNDGKDDIVGRHKLNNVWNDPTWVDEVVFSNGTSSTAVNQWILPNTTNDPLPTLEGVGDFNGDGFDDVWGLRNLTVIVGPPMLSESRAAIWKGLSSGRGSSSQSGTMLAKPFAGMSFTTSQIDTRGSRAGRFDASADLIEDIVLEYSYSWNGTSYQELRVWKSGAVADIWANSGRNGGEQFAMVGDLDRDGFDDLIWIGTTPSHNINLFVRSTVKTITWANSGIPISGNGVPSYIWTTNPRLRKRKP